jgi:hypothetical protein
MAKQIKKYSKIALIIALSVTISVLYLGTPQVRAGILTGKEVRLTDSRISQTGVDYDFQATSTGGNISCIKVYFCTTASSPAWNGSGCTPATGISFGNVDTGNQAAWNNLTYSNWSVIASTSNYVLASTTSAEALGNSGSWVFGNISNPSATSSYYTWIYTFNDSDCTSLTEGGVVDSGLSAFAIFGGVTVTATVAESLTVSVHASSCADFLTGGDGHVVTSATTSINYGEITSKDEFYDSCQDIDIGTNASNGFIARIHKTQPLTSASSDVIDDGTCEGACGTSTEQVWDTNTYNGFGYCMADDTSNLAATADSGWGTNGCGVAAGSQYFKTISNGTTSAESIMQSNSATSTHTSFIGYRLSVDSAQAAGVYTTEIIYIVTPKF